MQDGGLKKKERYREKNNIGKRKIGDRLLVKKGSGERAIN